MPNITKWLVDSLTPKDKDYILWDDAIKGFGIKVTPKGRKSYLFKYLNQNKLQRRPSIGVHGSITCEQAREIAKDWSYQVSKGDDPAVSKKEDNGNVLVEAFCYRYLNEYATIFKKPKSAYDDERNIKRHIIPSLGSTRLDQLSKEQIESLHISLKNTPIMANHVRGIISKMLNLSEEWGLRPEGSNPVRFIKKYPSKTRERYLSSEEIDRLVLVLDEALETGSETPYVVALFKLLLLTGARLREIMHAKWEWVDFERKVLALPDSKTGKKHIRLSDAAIDILQNLPRVANNPYIIVGNKEGEPLKEPKKQWKRICDKAGLSDVRIHDLRHTYASKCVEQGISLQVVGELLGHRNARTTERYAHLVEDHVRQATEHVGSALGAIMQRNKHG